jgi:hypothetical protein
MRRHRWVAIVIMAMCSPAWSHPGHGGIVHETGSLAVIGLALIMGTATVLGVNFLRKVRP